MNTVYVLYSKKLGRYYVGSTGNLVDRLKRHNEGRSLYTKKGTPWTLVYKEEFANRTLAVQLERKIKGRGIERFLNDNNIRGVAQSGRACRQAG